MLRLFLLLTAGLIYAQEDTNNQSADNFGTNNNNSTVSSNNETTATTNNYNGAGSSPNSMPVGSAIAPSLMSNGMDSCLMSANGGVWTISGLYNQFTNLEGQVLANSSQEATIGSINERLLIVEQTMADSSLNELQGKLAELGTNLTAIMEAQKELLGLKDQFKDIDVAAKENTLLVNSYEARIKELENKINLHQREVDDIWKGMDAIANPLG